MVHSFFTLAVVWSLNYIKGCSIFDTTLVLCHVWNDEFFFTFANSCSLNSYYWLFDSWQDTSSNNIVQISLLPGEYNLTEPIEMRDYVILKGAHQFRRDEDLQQRTAYCALSYLGSDNFLKNQNSLLLRNNQPQFRTTVSYKISTTDNSELFAYINRNVALQSMLFISF